MTWRFRLFLLMAIALTMTPLAFMTGCQELPTEGGTSRIDETSPEASRLFADPREAVVAECLLAVMGWDWDVDRQIGGDAVGDWNYLANDLNAYNWIKSQYGSFCSNWSLFYSNVHGYGFYGGYGRGGQCASFANLILYRSGVWQHVLPRYRDSLADFNRGEGHRQYTKPASQARIGDILRTFDENGHTAIVVKLMAGGYGGPVTAVDLIDSNFVGNHHPYNQTEVIGRHVITTNGSGYRDLDNYYAIDLISLGGR